MIHSLVVRFSLVHCCLFVVCSFVVHSFISRRTCPFHLLFIQRVYLSMVAIVRHGRTRARTRACTVYIHSFNLKSVFVLYSHQSTFCIPIAVRVLWSGGLARHWWGKATKKQVVTGTRGAAHILVVLISLYRHQPREVSRLLRFVLSACWFVFVDDVAEITYKVVVI